MFRLASMQGKLSHFIATGVLVSALTAAHSQVPATDGRPAGVPPEFVATPMGYFHPTCVKQVAKDDVLHPDELAIYHADGSIDAMLTCAYQHFTADGVPVPIELASVSAETSKGDLVLLNPSPDADAVKPPSISHSWIVAVEAFTNSSYGKITTKFKVPKAPSSHDGQIIYLFPGMQDYPNTKTIVQPVLGWNTPYYSKAEEWSITSWNCCTKGTVYVSPGEPVKTGDTIYGEVVNQCKAGTLECGKWTIYTEDESTGAWTKLYNESNFGQTFNWGFGSVLEVYSVKKCSDYPVGGALESTSVSVYNDKFDKANQSWYTWLPAGKSATPQCNYGAYLDNSSGSSMTITY